MKPVRLCLFYGIILVQSIVAIHCREELQTENDIEEVEDEIDHVKRIVGGCIDNHKVYTEGDEVHNGDPCKHCSCHHGKILCHSKHCFPHFCPATNRAEGDCCPHCACKDNEGAEYEIGQSFSGGHKSHFFGMMCMECECHANSKGHPVAHCARPICPEVDNCIETMIPEGKCCPVCKSYGQKLKSCLFGRIPKPHGSHWKMDKCYSCSCSNGGINCSKHCPILSCKKKFNRGGCCSVCAGGHETRTFPPFPPQFVTKPPPRTFPPFPDFGGR